MTGKYLITTDMWFYAPDGKQYKAAWGDVTVLDDTVLGIKTNRNASNWYAKVGTEENHVIIAGCQIHYAVRCEQRPNDDNTMDWVVDGGTSKEYSRPSVIYFAE